MRCYPADAPAAAVQSYSLGALSEVEVAVVPSPAITVAPAPSSPYFWPTGLLSQWALQF